MIWTLTLNAVLDHVYRVSEDVSDTTLAQQSEHLAAGKGINVSRAMACLGHRSVAVVLCGPDTESRYRAELRSQGVVPRLVVGIPQTRQHVTVLGPIASLHLRERGLPSASDAPVRLESALQDIRAGDDVAFCGSVAPGLPAGFLDRLMRAIIARGARVWVDTSGDDLRLSLRTGVYAVKVNAGEMAQAIGRPVPDRGAAAEVVRGLLADGLPLACLTLGRQGLVLGYRGQVVHAPIPLESSVSAVGSGDAVLAALLASHRENADAAVLAAAGVAAGAANAATASPGNLDSAQYRALMDCAMALVRPE